jgi:hypothetical protein
MRHLIMGMNIKALKEGIIKKQYSGYLQKLVQNQLWVQRLACS